MKRAFVTLLVPALVWSQKAADPGEHGHGHEHVHPHQQAKHHHHPHKHPHQAGPGHHHVGEPKAPAGQPIGDVAPRILSFSPTEGPPGTKVTIKGAAFASGSAVSMGAVKLKVLSEKPAEIVVEVPRKANSDLLSVTHAGRGAAHSDKPFTVIRPPRITGFAPKSCEAGKRVVITGKSFRPGDEMTFASRRLQVVESKPTRITVIAPEGPKKDYFILRRGDLTVASRQRFAARPAPPQIFWFSPVTVPPGQNVRVAGQGFLSADQVKVGQKPVEVVARGPGFVEFTVDPQVTSGTITVHRPGASITSVARLGVARSPVLQGFEPRFGPPGTLVTLKGWNFQKSDQVVLGNRVLKTESATTEELTAVIPDLAKSGLFMVRRGESRAPAKVPFEVLYTPVIERFDPPTGPVGSNVTIHGQHFTKDSRVQYGSAVLRILSNTPTALTVVLPNRARAERFAVVTRGGQAQTPDVFKMLEYAVIKSFQPRFGPVGTQVTISGKNFTTGGRVYLGKLEAEVVAMSPTEIVVKVPGGARPGKFGVESHGRAIRTRAPFRVVTPPPPLSLVFEPMSGPPGANVTITIGRPFKPGDRVLFAGKQLKKSILPGRLRARVQLPSGAESGTFEVVVSGGKQRVQATRPFTVSKKAAGNAPGVY